MSEGLHGRIMVLGAAGMVGSACVRLISQNPNAELIPVTRADVDLVDSVATFNLIQQHAPDWIIVAAARVGGIYANSTYPKDFLYDNLAIEMNAIEGGYRAGVKHLLFLGSSCIYPKFAEQPIPEEALLSGCLEPSNAPYAIAKIAGIKLCEAYNRQHGVDYRSLMPANLYGPGDNYHPENSHVIPALLRRFHEAKQSGQTQVVVWGTGTPKREFLHVDDLARACMHVMQIPTQDYSRSLDANCSHVNVGTGKDLPISELASVIAKVVGFEGQIVFDHEKPDGTPRKVLDIQKIKRLGWAPQIDLLDGLGATYEAFLDSA